MYFVRTVYLNRDVARDSNLSLPRMEESRFDNPVNVRR